MPGEEFAIGWGWKREPAAASPASSLITSSSSGHSARHLPPHFPRPKLPGFPETGKRITFHDGPSLRLVACHGIFQHHIKCYAAIRHTPSGGRGCRKWAAWPISDANHARCEEGRSLNTFCVCQCQWCRRSYCKLRAFSAHSTAGQIGRRCWDKNFGQMSIQEGRGTYIYGWIKFIWPRRSMARSKYGWMNEWIGRIGNT